MALRRPRVAFQYPLRDITPGQAVVLYSAEWLLGGGIISKPLERPTPGF